MTVAGDEAEARAEGPRAGEERSLSEIVARLERAGGDGAVSVNEMLGKFEDRSTVVVVAGLGLIALLPVIGAIPGVSIGVATLVLLSLAQSLRGRRGALRLPGRLGRREIGRERYRRGLERGRRWAGRVDRLLKERLTGLTRGRPQRAAILLAAALLAVTMYPLAFAPWGVTAPALGLVAFGLALIARDGLMALFGYMLCGATVATFYWGWNYVAANMGWI